MTRSTFILTRSLRSHYRVSGQVVQEGIQWGWGGDKGRAIGMIDVPNLINPTVPHPLTT